MEELMIGDALHEKLPRVFRDVEAFVREKNAQYGDSALSPMRVFSQAPIDEQIRVRMDDKVSRLARGNSSMESDRDVLRDLIGYCYLLNVHRLRSAMTFTTPGFERELSVAAGYIEAGAISVLIELARFYRYPRVDILVRQWLSVTVADGVVLFRNAARSTSSLSVEVTAAAFAAVRLADIDVERDLRPEEARPAALQINYDQFMKA